MGKAAIGVVLALLFSKATWAIAPGDAIRNLPQGTQITLKKMDTATLLAASTSLYWFDASDDKDGDGVRDSEDWCPETPAGTKVWQRKDAYENKVDTFYVGCSGIAGEKRTYDASKPEVTPEIGIVAHCSLNFYPSWDERTLASGTVFTVIAPGELTPDEYKMLYETNKPLLVKSPKGTHFAVRCDKSYQKLEYLGFNKSYLPKEVEYSRILLGSRFELERLQKVATVVIPPTVSVALSSTER